MNPGPPRPTGLTHLWMLAAATLAILVASTATAQERDADRVLPVLPEIAVSAGATFPSGSVDADHLLKRRVRALAPIEFEPGVRIFRYVGLSFRGIYAPGWAASPVRDDGICDLAREDDIETCSVRSTRLGAALTLHVLPAATIDPWASVGFTRERVRFDAKLPRVVSTDPNAGPLPGPWEVGYSLIGWSYPELRVGADVRIIGPLRLGAMASATWGKYEEQQEHCPRELPCVDVTLDPRKTHGWYGMGLRVSAIWPEPR